jgi:inorganic pyrophosphatase
MDEPAHVGCLLDVRLIGVIEAVQSGDGKRIRKDRLVGVAIHSHAHEHLKTLKEVNQAMLDQVISFLFLITRAAAESSK